VRVRARKVKYTRADGRGRRHNLVAALDPHNAGVLIVNLQGQAPGGAREIMGADDISRGLERNDQQCVVM
jgi:hypothetical protein